ncbi:ATP-binding cassette domain-containing protein [Bifidobacterium saguinibicoloris]|uniref:ATP-binding cassette domain-containing protein n=1 Tax=Bifidobacterium saguinibicoloris TaxID=2834433 RepID=UPI001C5632E4|nr:ATP-binding cassette domain-containing protein [Bifidobacterium saguinibicoloris]MBW3080966.1 ATP-binding cassette domain-containing protein [Bifidobacterium saguinibicoloris]
MSDADKTENTEDLTAEAEGQVAADTAEDTTEAAAEDQADEQVSFSVVFDDDPAVALPEDALEAETDETDSDADADADADTAADTEDDTDASETTASADDEPHVPQETSVETAKRNAKRVDATIALAADNLADKQPADPNEIPAATKANATSTHDIHVAAAQSHARLGRQVDDRVLLKSYPNFSLNHATTTNRKSGRHVLDNVSMAFYAGSLYAIRVLDDEDDPEQRVTLMQVLGGFVIPTSGAAMTKSSNLAELEINELRGHRLGLVPQRYAVRGDLDAEANVLYAMNASGRTYLKPKPIAAREFLARTGFGEATNGKKVGELSPLDQKRVAIARAISCEADTLILDEPTKGLDDQDAKAILALLRTIAHGRDPKRAVIIVTAQDDVAEAADKVYALED